MQLAIAPMLDWLDGAAQCFGVSGYSGAGTTPSDKNDPDKLRDNLMPYALTGHVHEREVTRQLGVPVEFMPHVAPHFRGLTITANLQLREPCDAAKRVGALSRALRGRAAGARRSTRRRGSAASPAGTAWKSAASRCRAGRQARWSWSPRSTTCSRARRRRRCRTSTSRSASTNSTGIPDAEQARMSDLLWQKPGVNVDARIQRFLAGDDVILDREFFLHDIAASKAHAEGLQRIGILVGRRTRRAWSASWMRWPTISAAAPSCSTSVSRMAIRRSRRA